MARTALVLATVIALAGCLADKDLGHGCGPAGGDVVWHQPGAFDAALALTGAEHHPTSPGPHPLPEGHPLRTLYRDSVVLRSVSWDEGDGGASVPFDVDPTFVHAGGDVKDLRRGVVAMARYLAADPSQVDAWAERHQVARLDTRSQPTPLDLDLDVAGAATEAIGAPGFVQQTSIDVPAGKTTWSLGVETVDVAGGPGRIRVLGGDWVRASIDANPADLQEAETWGEAVARGLGLPDGDRDGVHLQEQLVCD